MATHSSILAWEFPWTEEPGGLQSMGSQRDTTTTQQLNSNKREVRTPGGELGVCRSSALGNKASRNKSTGTNCDAHDNMNEA